MFIIDNKEKFEIFLSQSLNNELKEIKLIIPDLENKINKLIKFKICFNKSIIKNDVSTMMIPSLFINKVKEININKEIFSEKVIKCLLNNDLILHLNYETYETQNTLIKNENNVCEINENQEYFIKYSLPNYELIFEEFEKIDEDWIYQLIDIYQSWINEYNKVQYSYQLGGYGSYINMKNEKDFIGQINHNYGDDGSLYIYIKNDKIESCVDMY